MNFKHDNTYSTKACKVQAYAGVLWITSFIQYRVFSAETMQTMSTLKFAWWVRGKSIQLLRCMQYSCWLKLLNSSLEIKFCPAINCKISGQEPSNYSWAVFFFAVHGLYIFVLPTRCLRLAYAVAVFSYAGTICLDLPTRAYAYQLFSDFAYAACVCCFCGLSVGLNSSHFAYAVGASVVSWGVFCTSGLLGIATPGCRQKKDVKPHVSYHNNKTQLPISQQNTSSNTAYAEKNINQHPQTAYEKPTRASEMPTPALHKTYFV